MQEIEFRFYEKLKKLGFVSGSNVPKTIIKSKEFNSLTLSKIVIREKKGRGHIYIINKEDKFNDFYNKCFPNANIKVVDEITSQLKFKNTKAVFTEKERVILIRGNNNIIVDDIEVDLKSTTQNYGFLGMLFKKLYASKVCYVENLQSFLMADKLLGDEYVYIHFYGRLPKVDILKRLSCEEYLHFGDYDFTGLNEYLRACELYNNCNIYIPNNFDEIFDKYSKTREEKDVQHKNIKESTNPNVIRIKNKIEKGLFLEQQILFGVNNG